MVEEKDCLRVMEDFQKLIDRLIQRRIPVFESDVSTVVTCDEENAEEMRWEMKQ